MPTALQNTANFKGDHLSVNMFTGDADVFLSTGARVFDAAMTSGSNVVSSASSQFTNLSIGAVAWVRGGGAAGADLVTTITRRLSTTSFELADAAGSTVSGAEFRYGPDNTHAFQSAIDAISITKLHGGRILVPKGFYITTGTIYVPSHVRIEGECYVTTSVFGGTTVEPPSFVACVNPVPIFETRGAPCYSPSFAKLGLSGVSATGSKGIYGTTVWDMTVDDCFFDVFGDQGLHVEIWNFLPTASVAGTFRHNFAQNCCLVRTGRTDYVGAFDIGCTDAVIVGNDLSCGYADVSGVVAGGHICALVVKGPNSFGTQNQCGHAETGIYVSPDCNYSVFVNDRADLNQGNGWVIESVLCGYMACRAHANSLESDGGYDAFVIPGNGNSFIGCRNTFNGLGVGPEFNRVRNGFVATNPNTTQANTFLAGYLDPLSYTGSDYLTSGTQKAQPITDLTNIFPGLPGRAINRTRGDLVVDALPGGGPGILWIRDGGAGPDAKNWSIRVNNPTNFNQLQFGVWDDAVTVDSVYLRVTRSGGVATLVEVLTPAEFSNDVKVDGLTASRFVRSDGGNILSSAPAGVTGSIALVDNVTVSTTTIGYQGGANALTAVTGVSFTTTSLGFTDGQRLT